VRQYDQAIETELMCIRRNPNIFWSHVILGWAYQQKGMHREALAELQEGVKLTQGMPFTLAAYGQALAAAGDRRGAEHVLSKLHERARSVYVSAYDIALIHAALDDKAAAFRWLETARQERSSFLPVLDVGPSRGCPAQRSALRSAAATARVQVRTGRLNLALGTVDEYATRRGFEIIREFIELAADRPDAPSNPALSGSH
jgi:tetratricopeptide (TPR) repeat protein